MARNPSILRDHRPLDRSHHADKPNPDPERPSKLANLIPVIKPGKPADDPDAGATVTMPVMAAEGDQAEHEDMGMDASDAEAYAKLKARRAERRKKKLVHRAIAAGIALGISPSAAWPTARSTNLPQKKHTCPLQTSRTAAPTQTRSMQREPWNRSPPRSVSPAIDGTHRYGQCERGPGGRQRRCAHDHQKRRTRPRHSRGGAVS